MGICGSKEGPKVPKPKRGSAKQGISTNRSNALWEPMHPGVQKGFTKSGEPAKSVTGSRRDAFKRKGEFNHEASKMAPGKQPGQQAGAGEAGATGSWFKSDCWQSNAGTPSWVEKAESRFVNHPGNPNTRELSTGSWQTINTMDSNVKASTIRRLASTSAESRTYDIYAMSFVFLGFLVLRRFQFRQKWN